MIPPLIVKGSFTVNPALREHVNILQVRKTLGSSSWKYPVPCGDSAWGMSHVAGDGSVMVSVINGTDGHLWVHASMTRRDRVPSYHDLKLLHQAVFGDGYAYQIFVPSAEHVNVHEFALHLWGRLDGSDALPELH